MSEETAYRALVGLNWADEDDNEHHAEPGDKLTNLPENVIQQETKAGNLEEWVSGQTDNVRDLNEEKNMYGVLVDDSGKTMIMRDVNENA